MSRSSFANSERSLAYSSRQKCGFAVCGNLFDGCTALSEVVLSDICEISYRMFRGCTALKEIVLPASVKNVSGYAFEGSGLESLTLLCEEPVYITTAELPDTVKTIYVPEGVKAAIEENAAKDENFAYYWPAEKIALVKELDA